MEEQRRCWLGRGAQTYGLEEVEQVAAGFVGDGLGVDGPCGRVCCHYMLVRCCQTE